MTPFPITITNTLDPEQTERTSTITPPSYPYLRTIPQPCGILCLTTRPGQKSTSYYTDFPPTRTPPFPTEIPIKPGRPSGPGPCRFFCGRPCLLFCKSGCRLGFNCPTCPRNFPDPTNPMPPVPPPENPANPQDCNPDVDTSNGFCDDGMFQWILDIMTHFTNWHVYLCRRLPGGRVSSSTRQLCVEPEICATSYSK